MERMERKVLPVIQTREGPVVTQAIHTLVSPREGKEKGERWVPLTGTRLRSATLPALPRAIQDAADFYGVSDLTRSPFFGEDARHASGLTDAAKWRTQFPSNSAQRRVVFAYNDAYGFQRILRGDDILFDAHIEGMSLLRAVRIHRSEGGACERQSL